MKLILKLIILLSLFSCVKLVEENSEAFNPLIGSWSLREVCKFSSSGGYLKMDKVFTATTFDQTVNFYSDASCTTQLVSLILSGSYTTSNFVTSSLNEGKDIDSTLTGYMLTAKNAATVTGYNTNAYCGFSDWQIDVAKNLLGRTCDGSVMPSAGEVEYSIYKIQKASFFGSMIGDLLFGTDDATHDGKTPEQRYMTLDGTYPLIKQN